jgi:hypothetical protein
MLDAMGQTGLGGSRTNKAAVKGHYYLWDDTPLLAGSGIVMEYIDMTTGMVINPNLVPWTSSTKYGLRISVDA